MVSATRYNKIKIGDVYPTNGGTDVEVIKLVNSRSITVKFLDDYGYTTVVKNDHLQLGTIRNPKRYIQYDGSYLIRSDVKVGLILTNNKGETFTIIKRNTPTNFRVKFNDIHGYENNVELGSIVIGEVRNAYYLSVHGVGFFGEGPYVSRVNDIATKEYATWQSMLSRCYSTERQVKQPTYIGCTVHPDWHNFQTFAKWYTNQVGYLLGWSLDKDLIQKGNKIYSPKLCVLLPAEINAMLSSEFKVDAKELPMGIRQEGGSFMVGSFLNSEGVRDNSRYFRSLKAAIEFRNTSLDDRLSQINFKYYEIMDTGLLSIVINRLLSIYWLDYNNYAHMDPHYIKVKDCYSHISLYTVEKQINDHILLGDVDDPGTKD